MQYHYTSEKRAYARYTTEELRERFLLSGLYSEDAVNLHYTDVDRAIVGGLMPVHMALNLPVDRKLLGADYFTARREIGVINTGGAGRITIGDQVYDVKNRDSLYIGRGNPDITFESVWADNPAKFFLVSYPAHSTFPVRHVEKSAANELKIGQPKDCNDRVIFQSIVPGIVETCQIVMGFTELKEGNNWNTFPPHTHPRRMEIYSYFDLPEQAAVFHFMGEPQETRHLVMREGEAVVSPSWSIHSGVGTGNYTFIWAMGGENQEFDDMDGLDISEIA